MKKTGSLVLVVLLFLAGLGTAFYPIISNQQNQRVQQQLIEDYSTSVREEEPRRLEEEKARARKYNQNLLENGVVLSDPFDNTKYVPDSKTYGELLNVSDETVMAYLHIPKINVQLPVRHTTDEEVLLKSVGHLEGSSLPIGGEGCHTVLSAHRGLPSATLFTDLDLLEQGDLFYLYVLDEILAYRVDNIQVVEPNDVASLAIVPGEDYATLITCTPYSVNSHRLLVRGVRTEYIPEDEAAAAPASGYQLYRYELIVLGLCGVTLLSVAVILYSTRRNHKKGKGDETHIESQTRED